VPVAFNMSREINRAEDFDVSEDIEMSEEPQLRRYVCGLTMETERLKIPPRNLSYIYRHHDASHQIPATLPRTLTSKLRLSS
jgi:hypothetical protein